MAGASMQFPLLGVTLPQLPFDMSAHLQAQALAASWLAATTAQHMHVQAAAAALLPTVDLQDPSLEAVASSMSLDPAHVLPQVEQTPPQTPLHSPRPAPRPAPRPLHSCESEKLRPTTMALNFGGRRKPQGRRRSVKELVRAYTCPHTECRRRYEAWRSLQAHLYSKHGERKRKTDYPQFDDLHIRGVTPSGGRSDFDMDSEPDQPSPSNSTTQSAASSEPGTPLELPFSSLSLPHFDSLALAHSLASYSAPELNVDIDSFVQSLLDEKQYLVL
eukprot:comp20607_c1_seq1/m.26600 comp20607_c1_seq1/g.26600  ORF comp20607_c1_seq1/g.26600 comp20607_c1_seq1/m.26600 type:complete len:274 (-) comp20607_c1_seq1:391-1212(-)